MTDPCLEDIDRAMAVINFLVADEVVVEKIKTSFSRGVEISKLFTLIIQLLPLECS